MKANVNYKTLIDDLGALSAQRTEIEAKEEAVKEKLLGLAKGSYDGNLFRMTIIEYDREVLDMKAIRAKLSKRFLIKHTRYTPVRQFRIGARTGVIAKHREVI